MKKVFPEFYFDFRCLAEACRHSCCKGWEIDVDEASRRRYEAVPGELGQRLRASLIRDEDGCHFRLTEDERCPFLQEDGLCELICQLGKESLCEICTLHPRFFTDFGELRLCGLGLSCEAVCKLFLMGDGPLRFRFEGEETEVTLCDLLGTQGIALKADALRFSPMLSKLELQGLLNGFEKTEPIDRTWTELLSVLQERLDEEEAAVWVYEQIYDRARYDRIFQYILYRQLDRLTDQGMEPLLAYARASTSFVFLLDAMGQGTAEALRRWSEQIEYSTENVEILLEAMSGQAEESATDPFMGQ